MGFKVGLFPLLWIRRMSIDRAIDCRPWQAQPVDRATSEQNQRRYPGVGDVAGRARLTIGGIYRIFKTIFIACSPFTVLQ